MQLHQCINTNCHQGDVHPRQSCFLAACPGKFKEHSRCSLDLFWSCVQVLTSPSNWPLHQHNKKSLLLSTHIVFVTLCKNIQRQKSTQRSRESTVRGAALRTRICQRWRLDNDVMLTATTLHQSPSGAVRPHTHTSKSHQALSDHTHTHHHHIRLCQTTQTHTHQTSDHNIIPPTCNNNWTGVIIFAEWPTVRPSFHLFCYKSCEHDILKTTRPTVLRTGTTGPRGSDNQLRFGGSTNWHNWSTGINQLRFGGSANWHNWSTGIRQSTEFWGFGWEIKDQCHMTPNLDLEAWQKDHSWPVRSARFSSFQYMASYTNASTKLLEMWAYLQINDKVLPVWHWLYHVVCTWIQSINQSINQSEED